MQEVWEVNISTHQPRQEQEYSISLAHLPGVNIKFECYNPNVFIEALAQQKVQKDEGPKKKINTRGVLKVSGFDDFDP